MSAVRVSAARWNRVALVVMLVAPVLADGGAAAGAVSDVSDVSDVHV